MSEYITTVTDSHVVVQLPPAPQVAPPASFDISKRAFIKRLTPDFWLDIEDSAASIRDLRKLVLLFNNSSYINLKDTDVVAGVSAALNPLMPVQLQKTQAEVDAILLTPCRPGEEP